MGAGMGTLEIAMLIILGVCVLFGLIGGVSKGFGRSFIRFLTIAGSAVGAYFLKSILLNKALEGQIDGKSVKDYILDTICSTEELAKFKDQIWPIMQVMMEIIIFLVIFVLFVFIVSWIVYGILRLIVIHSKEKKGRFAGLIIGILNGAVVGLILVNVLTGLTTNVEKVANVEFDGKTVLQMAGSNVEESYNSSGIEDYNNSKTASYVAMANPYCFDLVSKSTIDGKEYTLDGQIDGLSGAVSIANAVKGLESIDLSSGVTAANKEELKKVISDVGASYSELPEEAKEVVDNLVSSLSSTLGIEGDLDLDKIDFEKAADLIDAVKEDGESYTDAEISSLLTTAAESGIAEMLSEANVKFEVSEEEKEAFASKIDSMTFEGMSEEEAKAQQEALKELFGITD